jgi:uroporphyrinogen-III synthase
MRVLVLRPGDGARRTAARLAELGHEAICAPVLETVATGEPAPEGAFDAVLATSAQAFRLAEPRALAGFTRLPLHCVGARTAQAAREAGFSIANEARDARTLAETMAARAPRQALYLAGRDRKPDLERALAAAGTIVTPWIVYEARALNALDPAAAAALASGGVDAALHYSPRSAEIFCALVSALALEPLVRNLLHIAISADAARPLAALPPVRVRVAAAPDEAHMLALLD